MAIRLRVEEVQSLTLYSEFFLTIQQLDFQHNSDLLGVKGPHFVAENQGSSCGPAFNCSCDVNHLSSDERVKSLRPS